MIDPTTKAVIVERELPHPPEKIWRALTQSTLMEQWLMSNDFLPVVGHRFTLRAGAIPKWDGKIQCEVLRVEIDSHLSYTWEALGLKTVVTWMLTPTKTGTCLRMEQSGFASEKSASYKGAGQGWQKFIGNLEHIVAQQT